MSKRSGAPNAGVCVVVPSGVATDVAELAHDQERQAPPELASLRRALATSKRQLALTRLQMHTLTRSNKHLKLKLARFAQEVARARHFAYHDELTGLPNRSLLRDRLTQALAQATRRHKQVVLLFLDLNDFKSVNDRFGHAAGDQLLRQVAQRLIGCIRGADTACRYGGDEFVIMLPEFGGGESALAVVEKISAHLAVPYAVGGGVVGVTASIGIAIGPNDGGNYNDLVKRADCAMYATKIRGGPSPNLLQ